jgi:hypothetical protein
MGFPRFLRRMVLQPSLRLAALNLHSRSNLHDSAPLRMQQLLLLQVLHQWLRQTRRHLLRNRLPQERKRGQQAGNCSFHLLFAGSASSNISMSLAVRNVFISQGLGYCVPVGSFRLQPNNLAQKTVTDEITVVEFSRFPQRRRLSWRVRGQR